MSYRLPAAFLVSVAGAFLLALVFSPAASAEALTPSLSPALECQECFQYGVWYDKKHYFSDQGPVLTCGGSCHTNIVDGTCAADDHDECQVDNNPVADLGFDLIQSLVQQGGADDVRLLLASYADSIILDASHEAIRITSCDGESLVAFFPVSREVLGSLLE